MTGSSSWLDETDWSFSRVTRTDAVLGAGAATAGPGQLADVALSAGAATAGLGQLAALGAGAATAGPGELAALGAARFSAMLDPLAAGTGSEGFRSWQSSVSMLWRSLGKVWKLLQVLWLVCRG